MACCVLGTACARLRAAREIVEVDTRLDYEPKKAPGPKGKKAGDKEKPPPKPPPPEGGASGVTFDAARLSSARMLAHTPPAEERAPRGAGLDELAVQPAAIQAGPPGPPPSAAKTFGDPEVARPDELTPLPQDRPVKYTSPKKLEELKETPKPVTPADASPEPEDEGPALDMAAFPAGFGSPETQPMHDKVPETAVTDPSQLGSYHIQVGTCAAFEGGFYDKVYPFMADVDLPGDLRGKKTRPGYYYVRWALVDLLGFEHPFTRPQRAVLRASR